LNTRISRLSAGNCFHVFTMFSPATSLARILYFSDDRRYAFHKDDTNLDRGPSLLVSLMAVTTQRPVRFTAKLDHIVPRYILYPCGRKSSPWPTLTVDAVSWRAMRMRSDFPKRIEQRKPTKVDITPSCGRVQHSLAYRENPA
jgi:hypothetical protein